MALYVGEAVRIRATAVDPETGTPLPAPIAATVDFWAPGKNPVKDPAVRDAPDVPAQAMTHRPDAGDFVLFQGTAGAPWVAGKWTYRVTVVGEAFSNWEYATFVLKA